MEGDTKAGAILKRFESAKANLNAMSSHWRDIADYTRPVKQDINIDSSFRNNVNRARLSDIFDTTAIDANLTYASGCMSWMTPSETRWFSFDPPEHLKESDEVKRWYSTCSDIAQTELANSNFYGQIHESYLDDGAFGTCCLHTEENDGLKFKTFEIGDYAIIENSDRIVDTVFQERRLTIRQAAQEYGEQNLPVDLQKKLADKPEDQCTFVHVWMPRPDAERSFGKVDAENMPIASIAIEVKHKQIVRESGAWEMPPAVHRHLLWSRMPYGFSPGMQSLADIRQLQTMQAYLDALVEKQVSPPVKAHHSFKGNSIDLRAGGVTFYKDEHSEPKFWENPGRYIIGEDRVEFRQRQIDRAFHVELFQALKSVPVGKEMTAAEIHLRQRDRLTLFSPTFSRKSTELISPTMKRVFAIMLRGNAFPRPPQEVLSVSPEGLAFIPDPQIVYTSRLALQIKAIHNDSALRAAEMIGPFGEVNPGVFDHIDFDAMTPGIMRNEGVPEEWIRSRADVEEIRKAREEERQRMLEEESQHREAESIAKLAQSNVIQGNA